VKKVYAHYRIDNMGALHHSGGVTVYGEWEPETGELLAMGAVCTLEDNYNYKRGRAIAEGRFRKYHNVQPDIGGINVPQQYTASSSEQVHSLLALVATDLSDYIKVKEGGLSLRRYYRSVGEFEERA
jgi:hypothetical protein